MEGWVRKRSGLDALLDAIENLQGAPLPASIFETEILAARIDGYNPADLDALTAGGEIVWCGVEALGDRDGRVALYLTDHFGRLRREEPAPELSPREQAIVAHLAESGASFFSDLHRAAGDGYPAETVEALWDLVWTGRSPTTSFTRAGSPVRAADAGAGGRAEHLRSGGRASVSEGAGRGGQPWSGARSPMNGPPPPAETAARYVSWTRDSRGRRHKRWLSRLTCQGVEDAGGPPRLFRRRRGATHSAAVALDLLRRCAHCQMMPKTWRSRHGTSQSQRNREIPWRRSGAARSRPASPEASATAGRGPRAE